MSGTAVAGDCRQNVYNPGSTSRRQGEAPSGDNPERRLFALWRCDCGQVLGEAAGGTLLVRHSVLELRIVGSIERRCHRCGRWERWDG